MSPIGSSRRLWLNQSTQANVAYSTSLTFFQGPRCRITSVLNNPTAVSARAKKADAVFRISFAHLSSLFSFSNALSRARPSAVNPSRRPVSTSNRLTQLRSVSGVHPILLAIDTVAAHRDSYYLRHRRSQSYAMMH